MSLPIVLCVPPLLLLRIWKEEEADVCGESGIACSKSIFFQQRMRENVLLTFVVTTDSFDDIITLWLCVQCRVGLVCTTWLCHVISDTWQFDVFNNELGPLKTISGEGFHGGGSVVWEDVLCGDNCLEGSYTGIIFKKCSNCHVSDIICLSHIVKMGPTL